MEYKVSESTKKAASLMLKYIVDHYGGVTEVANKAKTSRQLVHSFLTYGYVPVAEKSTYHFSRTLKVSPWAISYVKLMEIFGESSLKLLDVVRDLNFLSDDQRNEILKVAKKR